MVRDSSNGQMAVNTMENGNQIWSMGKERTSGQIAHSRKESGKKTTGMEKGSLSGQMVHIMKESLWMTVSKGTEDLCGQRVSINKKVHGSKTWNKEGVKKCSAMVINKMETTKMERNMGMAGKSGNQEQSMKASKGII